MSEVTERSETTAEHQSIDGLVRHIVAKHHVFTRREIGVIKEMFEKCKRENVAEQDTLASVKRFFVSLAEDMFEHMRKEEEQLFPALLDSSASGNMADLAEVMRELDAEHEHVGDALIKMQMPVSEAMLPESDGGPLEELRRHLRLIDKDIREHVHAERDVLFPRVRKSMAGTSG